MYMVANGEANTSGFLNLSHQAYGSTAKLLNDSLRSWMERKEKECEGKIRFLAREQDKVI